MVQTTDGFVIAEADLRLRGPGNIEGTQQSGMLRFLLADIARDGQILSVARDTAKKILEQDPALAAPEHGRLKMAISQQVHDAKVWGRIS
jgi:ATP-dependent DNA helicase RecG